MTNENQVDKENSRVRFLDGLKGIAAMVVLFSHLVLAFVNANDIGVHIIMTTPLFWLINGHNMVVLFCIITGFIVAAKTINAKKPEKVCMIVPKRYLRIAIPLIPIAIWVYLGTKYGLFLNKEVGRAVDSNWFWWFYPEQLSIKELIMCLIYRVPFGENGTISPMLWMYKYIMVGTIYSVGVSLCYKYSKKIGLIISVLLALYYTFYANSLYACSVIGALMYFTFGNRKIEKRGACSMLGTALMVIGIFLGGYNYTNANCNLVYRIGGQIITDWQIFIVGQTMFFAGVFLCDWFKKIMSTRILKYFGKVSFAIFILQAPLMCTICSWTFIALNKRIDNIYLVGWLNVLISILITVTVADIYSRTIEKASIKIVDKIVVNLED